MHVRLRDGLYHCTCVGQTIFLDVNANRYFAVSQEVDRAFQALTHDGPPREPTSKALEPLLAAGLLVSADAPGQIAQHDEMIPAKQDFHRRPVKPSFFAGAQALFHRYRAARKVRDQPFATVLQDVRERKASLTSIAHDPAGEISLVLSAFASTGLVFRARDQCLPQSIAFHRLCLDRAVPATLVIGVSVNPFAAHCWVQLGDTVINDRAERIRQFTPILEI